ncbi:MAG: BREX-1 system phosphatase PglZ type B, partial [Thermoguttaceae bacterium]
PHFVTLGEYKPDEKTGPAIWLRCMIAKTLPEADWGCSVTPILYLPGVSRQELRAITECPSHLSPLAELQYRGVFWSQKNAKDWTIAAFLQSEDGGLGLDVARDQATLEAIRRAVVRISETPVEVLQGRKLEASDFHALLTPDPAKAMLSWLNNPKATQAGWTAEEWEAFAEQCRKQYGFDPKTDGELAGAERLGLREGLWETVWSRFVESPRQYPDLPKLLDQATPSSKGQLFDTKCVPESWPRFNRQSEDALRTALAGTASKSPHDAREEIQKLEKEHGERRGWVWAALGHAPLAGSLEHLAEVAKATATPVAGASPEHMASSYAESGWKADAACLQALAAVDRLEDHNVVTTVLRAIYLPWIEVAAERFQESVVDYPLPDYQTAKIDKPNTGCVVLFVDGLRFDVGKLLGLAAQQRGWDVDFGHRWSAIPTVTPTAKPAVSPVADRLTGKSAGRTVAFCPSIDEDDKPLNVDRFRKLLAEHKIQVLRGAETGDPKGRAWAEIGTHDHRGHDEGARLARLIADEIRQVVDRLQGLFDAGWREVRIVTDHGWLLMPGGLPKTDMPAYLTESRWSRCALIKEGNQPDVLRAAWFWNPMIHIAVAPGVSCFKAGQEYAHGSLSLQECLTPTLLVRPSIRITVEATIQNVKWVNLRCRVTVEASADGVAVDVRTKAANATTSLLPKRKPKPVGEKDTVSVAVDEEDKLGSAATVVLLDPGGTVIAKQNTVVGGEE